MLADGMRMLDEALAAQGETIVYLRGGTPLTLPAMPGRTKTELPQAGGGALRVSVSDWLISRTRLVLDGAEFAPAKGDIIRYTTGGMTFVYEVSRQGGLPPWEWLSGFACTYRVHVVLKDTEPA